MNVPIPSLKEKQALLFDYGGTLVQYYEREEFPPILQRALDNVSAYLSEIDFPPENEDVIWERAMNENYESNDYRVRPLDLRLKRIFNLEYITDEILWKMQKKFMESLFSAGKIYSDTLPTLKYLKHQHGLKIAIISNTAWGSPSSLWIDEMKRFQLNPNSEYVDLATFCYDVGWRKPAAPIFQQVLQILNLPPSVCLFIGDHPNWDIKGANQMKIDAILLDRNHKYSDLAIPKIHRLSDLLKFF